MAAQAKRKRSRARVYIQHRRVVRDRVRVLRLASGLTQKEFGRKLNVSRRAVQFWESGEAVPREEVRFQMEALFGQLVPNQQGDTTNATV
jgi:DNA-binding transcriptional regulator YiaG